MKVVYELPEPYGGQLTVTDDELVPLGDAMAHKQLTYSRTGNDKGPACQIVFEVRSGIPQCVSLNLSAADGACAVRPKDLGAIALEKMCHDFFAYVGIYRPNPDGGWVHKRGDESLFRRDRRTVEKAAERRKMTDALKQTVADVCNAAPVGGRISAIQAAFNVSERTAKRYKKEAQEAGLIDNE